ncbi:hypothetical protein BH11MYX4_BH11MYX4_52990 [soil metagenome]
MMTMRLRSLVMGAAAAGALLGCARDSRYPGDGPAPDESAALGRIALTRLAHEQACRRPGGPGDGPDVDGRMKELRSATEAEIKPGWCKSNVHPQALDDCLSQIKSWPCDVELKNVTLIETCKVEPLCGVPATEGTL